MSEQNVCLCVFFVSFPGMPPLHLASMFFVFVFVCVFLWNDYFAPNDHIFVFTFVCLFLFNNVFYLLQHVCICFFGFFLLGYIEYQFFA